MSPTGVDSQLRTIINGIKSYDTDSRQVVAVLSVYRDSLKQIFNTLEKSFSGIKSYLSAVNYFLQGKQIIYAENLNSINSLIQIRFEDDSLYNGLSALSSGERQIITLIYAATNMSKQQLVLIDEPEISLHIDWQRELLQKMSEQLPNHQIIACTHSPTVGADYEDCLQELNLKPTNKNNWYKDSDIEKIFEYLEDNSTENELEI
ncbi:AAA family ATPase [Scytonema sp. UIC 10036]|uniref:AAA family ATPase n=1 Tax=Scytonema sp. UIC 10036 TaxID=2304196 RepID=UPI0012DAE2C2|nr:AAA family ATPase [Scytonema sp. UIC 10036]MUH00032.1 AAA family ATPase [Scytonema sp. UIC 10036]